MKLARTAILALIAALALPATGLCDTPKKPTSTTTDKDSKSKTTTSNTTSKDSKTPGSTGSKTNTKTDSKPPAGK
jgi:hypothetical protein